MIAEITILSEVKHASKLRLFKIPLQIQDLLLPIFMDKREPREVKIAATTVIVSTKPCYALLAVMAAELPKEADKEFVSFVYTFLSSLAKSEDISFKIMLVSQQLNALDITESNTGEIMNHVNLFRCKLPSEFDLGLSLFSEGSTPRRLLYWPNQHCLNIK